MFLSAIWIHFASALPFCDRAGGRRNEQLNRDGMGTSEKSQSVGKVVVTGAAGVRFFAATMGESWNYRLQLGLVATVPLSKEFVQIEADQFTLQKPALGIMLGMTFDHD